MAVTQRYQIRIPGIYEHFFIWKKFFADIIKDLEMKALSWVSWVDLKSNDKYPYKEGWGRRRFDRRKGGGNEATETEIGEMLP